MKLQGSWYQRFVWLASAVTMLASLEALSTAEAKQGVEGGPKLAGVGNRNSEVHGEVPFKLQDGYLVVVEGRIGAQRHVRFALDTGATQSAVRPEIVKGHVSAGAAVRIVNLDHVITQQVVEVEDLELGPTRIPQLLMMVNELEYLRRTAPEVDGVIGLDVMRLRSFRIDFGRRKIIFGSPRQLRSSADMEMNPSYLAVQIRMMDRLVRLVVDTGVSSILLYRDRMGDRLPNVKIERQVRGASLGGSALLDVVTLPRMQLSGTELERRAVLLGNSPAGFLPGVDGYLSLSALRAWQVSFDFEKSRLSWE
jgi:hypothetical protein